MGVDTQARPGGSPHVPVQALRATFMAPDAPEWMAILRDSPHDCYHLPRYVTLCARLDRGVACALRVTDGHRTLLLPFVRRPVSGGRFDLASPYGYPGPVGTGTDDDAFLMDALAAGRRAMHDAGAVSAFVRLHPLLNRSPMDGIGSLVRHGDTVAVDLTLPADLAWSRMRLNHRRDITRAKALGYVARIDADWAALGEFERLYGLTMTRRAAAPEYFFDHGYFRELHRALGERLQLCVVEREGIVAAAGLFVETAGIVQYHLGGWDDEHREAQPMKLMIDFVRRWARERGDVTLHLGGGLGARNDLLFHFKAGFSPDRHPFRTLRLVVDGEAYRQLVLARDPLADPDDLLGFFPAYRQP